VRAAIEGPGDLFYGGTTGALAATAEASARTGTPYGLDLEDFHSEEQEGPDGALMNELAGRIEARVLPKAAFLTTSSVAIAARRATPQVCGGDDDQQHISTPTGAPESCIPRGRTQERTGSVRRSDRTRVRPSSPVLV
jgi:hypothetical protein